MFNRGDKIVCINDNFEIQFKINHNHPIQDNIYTVRDCFPSFAKNTHAVLLNEIHNQLIEHPSKQGMFEPNFNVTRFALVEDDYAEDCEESLEEVF